MIRSELAALRDMEDRRPMERAGSEQLLYRFSKEVEQQYFGFDHTEVGTAPDVAKVADKVVAAYLKQ